MDTVTQTVVVYDAGVQIKQWHPLPTEASMQRLQRLLQDFVCYEKDEMCDIYVLEKRPKAGKNTLSRVIQEGYRRNLQRIVLYDKQGTAIYAFPVHRYGWHKAEIERLMPRVGRFEATYGTSGPYGHLVCAY